MYKLSLSSFILLVSLVVGGHIVIESAYASPELKFAYVDLEKALASSKAGQAAKKDYSEEVKRASSDLEKKKDELKSLQEQFDKQSKSLSQEARDRKMDDLMSREKDLKRLYQDSKESLQRKESKLLGDLIDRLRVVVQEVGDEKNYTMIFEKSSQAVLYANQSIDITDEVIQRFNKLDK